MAFTQLRILTVAMAIEKIVELNYQKKTAEVQPRSDS